MDTRSNTQIARRVSEIKDLISLYELCGDPDARYDIARLKSELHTLTDQPA